MPRPRIVRRGRPRRREVLKEEEKEMVGKVEACADCTQKCSIIHGNKDDSSPTVTSFFKVMFGDEFSKILYLPPNFACKVATLVGQNLLLEDWTRRKWRVVLTKLGGFLAFQEGWEDFSSHHGLEVGEFVVFHYVVGSHFVVQIFSRTGCEKQVSVRDKRNQNETQRKLDPDGEKCHVIDRSAMIKKDLRNTALLGSKLGKIEHHSDAKNAEKVSLVNGIFSNCANTNKRKLCESKADEIEAPDSITVRDPEQNRVDGNYARIKSETLESKSWVDKANKGLVHPRKSTRGGNPTETGFGYRDPAPVEVAHKIVNSSVSKIEVKEKNTVPRVSRKDADFNVPGCSPTMSAVKPGKNAEKNPDITNIVQNEGITAGKNVNMHSSHSKKRIKEEVAQSAQMSRTSQYHREAILQRHDKRTKLDRQDSVQMSRAPHDSKEMISSAQDYKETFSQKSNKVKFVKQESVQMSQSPQTPHDHKEMISSAQDSEQRKRVTIIKQEAVQKTRAQHIHKEMISQLRGPVPQFIKEEHRQSSKHSAEDKQVLIKREVVNSSGVCSPAVVTFTCSVATVPQSFLELPMCLPVYHGSRRSKSDRMVAILRGPSMKLWSVLYIEADNTQLFTSGWEAFSIANNIHPGDKCVFTAESERDAIYRVRIVRKPKSFLK